jgi:hypothetical protein
MAHPCSMWVKPSRLTWTYHLVRGSCADGLEALLVTVPSSWNMQHSARTEALQSNPQLCLSVLGITLFIILAVLHG